MATTASQKRRQQRRDSPVRQLIDRIEALEERLCHLSSSARSDSTFAGSDTSVSVGETPDSWDGTLSFDCGCQTDFVGVDVEPAVMLSVGIQTEEVLELPLDELDWLGGSCDVFALGTTVASTSFPLVCDGTSLVESGLKALDVEMIASMRNCQDLVDALLDFEAPLPTDLALVCVPAPRELVQGDASFELHSDFYTFMDSIPVFPIGSLDVDNISIKHNLTGFGTAMRDFVASAHAALDLAIQDQDDFGMPLVMDSDFVEFELSVALRTVMKLDGLSTPQHLALDYGTVIGIP